MRRGPHEVRIDPMSSTDPAVDSMAANLEQKTGRSLDEWVALVRAQDLEKHGQMISYLKSEYGMTHGYANLVASRARAEPGSAEDLVAAQYSGSKASLRPTYEAILGEVSRLGPDVEVAPKKTYVSLRRRKQFALLKPATRSQIEIGLDLPGEPASERLRATSGMCSHLVRVGSSDEIDAELRGWLRAAYERA
jgi:predicted transport protein